MQRLTGAWLRATLLLAGLFTQQAAAAASEGATCDLNVFVDISCTQSAFAWTNASSFAACCADCDAEEGCFACEWVASSRRGKGPCHLKALPGSKISQPGTTCGISKTLPPTPTPPPPQQAPAAWPPVWPAPKLFTNGTEDATLAASFAFEVAVGTVSTATLTQALQRYERIVLGDPARRPNSGGSGPGLTKLAVSVEDSDETVPHEGTDESYTLHVPTDGAATLRAQSVYGALRGLETFSQLTTYNFSASRLSVRGAPWLITDSPRFSFRGLMLDTSRHFIPLPMFERLLEAMAYLLKTIRVSLPLSLPLSASLSASLCLPLIR
eukprot:COSAG03_NODE_4849_length_1413_cov_3.674277_1_plen_325_part_00